MRNKFMRFAQRCFIGAIWTGTAAGVYGAVTHQIVAIIAEIVQLTAATIGWYAVEAYFHHSRKEQQ